MLLHLLIFSILSIFLVFVNMKIVIYLLRQSRFYLFANVNRLVITPIPCLGLAWIFGRLRPFSALYFSLIHARPRIPPSTDVQLCQSGCSGAERPSHDYNQNMRKLLKPSSGTPVTFTRWAAAVRQRRWFAHLKLLVLVVAIHASEAAAEQNCDWGDGSVTPLSVFKQSCHAAGGAPVGCSCQHGAGSSGASGFQRAYQQGYANAAAWARMRQLQQHPPTVPEELSGQQQQQAAQQNEQDWQQQQSDYATQRRAVEQQRNQDQAERKAHFLIQRDISAAGLLGDTAAGTSDELMGAGDASVSGAKPGVTSGAHGKWTCPLVSDTHIVDGCGVPSGLLKFVDEALSRFPASDVQRKAYQAIQAHDWKAARAWFQVALQRAPGDPGIQRMIWWSGEEIAARGGKGGEPIPARIDTLFTSLAPQRDDPAFAPQYRQYLQQSAPTQLAPSVRSDLAGIYAQRASAPLSSADARRRADSMVRDAADLDEFGEEHLAMGFLFPEGEAGQEYFDAATVDHEIAQELRLNAAAMRQCHCEAHIVIPKYADMKLMFSQP